MKSIIAFLIGTLSLLSFSALAVNGSASLSLSITGNVYATPAWHVNGAANNTASYTFAAFGIGSGTITSQTTTLNVVNASVLGGDSISFTPPTGCKVGTQNVNAAFVENGHTYTAAGAISSVSDFTGSAIATNIQLLGVTAPGVISGCSGASLAYVY